LHQAPKSVALVNFVLGFIRSEEDFHGKRR
jgi:hypothetical protein